MAKADPDRDEFNKAVRDHIRALLKGGVSRREMALVLGVTQAAISSYVLDRTTPKPHLIERLLIKWPTKLAFRGEAFGVGAFGGSRPKPELVAYQRSLYSALSSIRAENIEVVPAGATDVELKFSIRIAG
jgi:transcriptional regulator with XRE-family HTH domain